MFLYSKRMLHEGCDWRFFLLDTRNVLINEFHDSKIFGPCDLLYYFTMNFLLFLFFFSFFSLLSSLLLFPDSTIFIPSSIGIDFSFTCACVCVYVYLFAHGNLLLFRSQDSDHLLVQDNSKCCSKVNYSHSIAYSESSNIKNVNLDPWIWLVFPIRLYNL